MSDSSDQRDLAGMQHGGRARWGLLRQTWLDSRRRHRRRRTRRRYNLLRLDDGRRGGRSQGEVAANQWPRQEQRYAFRGTGKAAVLGHDSSRSGRGGPASRPLRSCRGKGWRDIAHEGIHIESGRRVAAFRQRTADLLPSAVGRPRARWHRLWATRGRGDRWRDRHRAQIRSLAGYGEIRAVPRAPGGVLRLLIRGQMLRWPRVKRKRGE